MKEFTYTYKINFSEKEYVRLNARFDTSRIKKNFRRGLLLLITISMYFSSYTVILGILLTIISIIGFIAPRFLKPSLARQFHDNKYLHDEIKYDLSQDEILISSENFSLKMNWDNISFWSEFLDWLIIYSNGFPTIYIPIKDLKKHRVKTVVYEIVKRNAKKR